MFVTAITMPVPICVSFCAEKQAIEAEAEDELDAFMMSIKSGGLDTQTRSHLKRRCVELRHQRIHLQRLIKVARPCDLPPLADK